MDQGNLLSPEPSLDRLLTRDRVVHILECFIVNESVNSVVSREAGVHLILMFPCAAIDVVSDTSVKYPRFAGEQCRRRSGA